MHTKLVVEDLLRSSKLANDDSEILCALFKGGNGNRLLQFDLQWRRMATVGGPTNITNYQTGGDLEGLLHCKVKEEGKQFVASAKMTTEASLGTHRQGVQFWYESSDGQEIEYATCVVTSETHPQANRRSASYAM